MLGWKVCWPCKDTGIKGRWHWRVPVLTSKPVLGPASRVCAGMTYLHAKWSGILAILTGGIGDPCSTLECTAPINKLVINTYDYLFLLWNLESLYCFVRMNLIENVVAKYELLPCHIVLVCMSTYFSTVKTFLSLLWFTGFCMLMSQILYLCFILCIYKLYFFVEIQFWHHYCLLRTCQVVGLSRTCCLSYTGTCTKKT